MAFVTLPEEEYIASLSFTQLLTLPDSTLYPHVKATTSLALSLADPTLSLYHSFIVLASLPVMLYRPRVVYDPVLACELYEVPVMEQLPPLPAPTEPTYQFYLVMADLLPFCSKPYGFKTFALFLQHQEAELTRAAQAHGEALKAHFHVQQTVPV